MICIIDIQLKGAFSHLYSDVEKTNRAKLSGKIIWHEAHHTAKQQGSQETISLTSLFNKLIPAQHTAKENACWSKIL